MDIGIVGAGNVGRTLAEHLTDLGHDVTISSSWDRESQTDLADQLGPRAHAGTVRDAASASDLVVEAIPFGAYESLPADALADTGVVSAANYYPDRNGEIDL